MALAQMPRNQDCELIELRLEYDRQWRLIYKKNTDARGLIPLIGCHNSNVEGRQEAQKMAENWLDRNEPGWRGCCATN